jgi:hypothetical protein
MTEYEYYTPWLGFDPVEGGELVTMSGKRKSKRKAKKAKRKEKRKAKKAKRKEKRKAKKAKRKAKRKARRNRRQTRKMERRMKKKGVGKAKGEAEEMLRMAEDYADVASTDAPLVEASTGNKKALMIGGVLAVAAAGAYWWYENR